MSQLTEIQKQIQTTLEDFESVKNVESHVNEINEQLNLAYNKLKVLDSKLDKELKDIEELEKLGVKSLFYKTLGNKEAQLEKERQEYLEASLKYKELKASVELMEFEKDILNKKINQLPELEYKLKALKKTREQEILTHSEVHIQNEFREILHQIDVSVLLRKELKEAITEGDKAMNDLKVVATFLHKAGDWGNWQMRGDRRGAYNKKRAIDQALNNMTRAQHQLNLFTRELKDLGENNIAFKLNRVHFNNFTDFFFDNLISDWIVQQRIKNTLGNIEGTYAHVQRLVLSIKQELQTTESKISQLNTQKDSYLLSS